MRLFILLLALTFHVAEADVPAYFVGDLKPGPYAVGYRVDKELDYSRSYRLQRNENGDLPRQQGVRPMPISIWYPAEADGNPQYMRFREYIYVEYAKESLKSVSTDAEKIAAEQEFFDTEIWTGTPDIAKMRMVLDTQTTVVQNSKAIDKKFPLILYSVREDRGTLMNTVLLEYLASHGYVVAAVPNKSRHPATRDVVLHGSASAEDLRFLKLHAQALDNVDPQHIGMIGYGIGALIMVDTALDHWELYSGYPVAALVSLTGTLGSRAKPEYFTTLSARIPVTAVNIPFMQLTCGGEDACDTQENHDKIIRDQLDNADAWFLKFSGLDELGFSSFFMRVFYESIEESDNLDIESMHRGYAIMSQYTLAMMDTWLKDNAGAKSFLNRSLIETGFADVISNVNIVHKDAGNE